MLETVDKVRYANDTRQVNENHTLKTAVVLASFNGARYLLPLLESLASQNAPIHALVCADDLSDDRTQEIVASIRLTGMDTVFLPPLPERLGPARNFARILEQARDFDFVLLADQDDVWHPGKVESLLERARSAPCDHPLLVYSDARVIDGQERLLAQSAARWQGFDLRSGLDFRRTLIQNTVPGCTMLVNRALLEAALPIPESAVMHDWWLLLVAHALGEVRCVPKALLDYRQHESNTLGADAWNARRIAAKLRGGPFAVRRRVRAGWRAAWAQAATLHERYADRMPADRRALLESVLALPEQGALKKRFTAARHGLRKEGLSRTLAWYWAL